MEYIGISEERLKHMLSVARSCYSQAKDMGFSEEECRQKFFIGLIHDIGYEFSAVPENHSSVGYEILKSMGLDLPEILNHGNPEIIQDINLKILNLADQTIDNRGTKVTIEERLDDIRYRYGMCSKQYIDALRLSLMLKE